MKKSLFILLLAYFSAGRGYSMPASDPCASSDFRPNLWRLTVDSEGQASKRGLLRTWALVATPGFHSEAAACPECGSDRGMALFLSFTPEEDSDAEDATGHKEQVLAALTAVRGNVLSCVPYIQPHPAMGVRN